MPTWGGDTLPSQRVPQRSFKIPYYTPNEIQNIRSKSLFPPYCETLPYILLVCYWPFLRVEIYEIYEDTQFYFELGRKQTLPRNTQKSVGTFVKYILFDISKCFCLTCVRYNNY